ncbi:MAG: MFS transporter [Chlorobaculum sp.]|nr:MFS transporter [Chlorobaculum sp.]
MEREKRFFGLSRNVFLAGLVSFFMDVSSEMIYPLVPLFLSSVLGVNKSMIGLIEGSAESMASLIKVFSGWISDRLGKRKGLMLAGYAVSTLSRPLVATAGSWPQVLASRLVDRFGKGVRTAPRDAIIAESTEESSLGRAFSFHRSMDTMGAVAGPGIAFLGLQVFHSGYRPLFWLSMVPGLLAVLIIALFITERKKAAPSGPSQSLKLSLSGFSGRARFFFLIVAIFALGNSSDAFLILRAGQLGIPAATIPVVYLLFNLIYSLTAIPAGIADDRYGKKRLILSGFLLFGVLYAGFALATTPHAAWLLFGLYGVFMGLTEGIQKAFLATLVPDSLKGTAYGIYAGAVGIAALPSSVIAGLLWDRISPAATFWFGADMAAISAVLFLMLIAGMRDRSSVTG